MMQHRVITAKIFPEPFRPFRIRTTSGQTFDVLYPEDVKIGRSILLVYAPLENDSNGPDRWEKVPLMLVESISPLDTASVNPNAK
jgi:hypothetical protein